MSLKHAILGFMAIQDFTGYDLKKAFDTSVQHFWPADQSQIYRTLSKLEEQGLIDKTIVQREEQLDLKVYSITETGREELHQWLSTPLASQINREPMLIQIFFADNLSKEELLHLLHTELNQLNEVMAIFEAIYKEAIKYHGNPIPTNAAFYYLLTLEYGIRANLVNRQWLLSVIERVEADDRSIIPFEPLQALHEK